MFSNILKIAAALAALGTTSVAPASAATIGAVVSEVVNNGKIVCSEIQGKEQMVCIGRFGHLAANLVILQLCMDSLPLASDKSQIIEAATALIGEIQTEKDSLSADYGY